MDQRRRLIPHDSSRGAFTLVEAVMSTLIVSVMLTAALSAAGVAATTQARTADRAEARFLADAMIADILALAYQDPTLPTLVCGPEANEVGSPKTAYDDCDDYNGYSESPPKSRGGTNFSGFSNWQRKATVQWCLPSNPLQTSASETGAKLITVRVYHNSVLIATRTAIKVNAP